VVATVATWSCTSVKDDTATVATLGGDGHQDGVDRHYDERRRGPKPDRGGGKVKDAGFACRQGGEPPGNRCGGHVLTGGVGWDAIFLA
jgi:hypothetical protein